MGDQRQHTKHYDDEARLRLGLAVTRAREAAGHPRRPSFVDLAGISVRSLFKLETGVAVGPGVYEAVARALPGWTGDTPIRILEDKNFRPPAVSPATGPAKVDMIGDGESSDGPAPGSLEWIQQFADDDVLLPMAIDIRVKLEILRRLQADRTARQVAERELSNDHS